MISVENEETILPIATLSNTNSAGLFFEKSKSGTVRVCNDHPLTIWVNGRLLKKIPGGCEFIKIEDFYRDLGSDTIFVSLHSDHNLASLTFEEVVFTDLILVNDDPKVVRSVRDVFNEFTFTALIMIALLFGFVSVRHTTRISQIVNKAFSLKQNTYEMVNTQFVSDVNASLVILLSLILAFISIYGAHETSLNGFIKPTSYLGFLSLWLKTAFYITAFIFVKWVFIYLISRLFRFRRINDLQLFDFVNFCLIFSIIILFLVFLDVVFKGTDTRIPSYFPVVLVSIIFVFILWFALKFVNDSPHKKLLIITYLCATEIIPAILLIGWFYK